MSRRYPISWMPPLLVGLVLLIVALVVLQMRACEQDRKESLEWNERTLCHGAAREEFKQLVKACILAGGCDCAHQARSAMGCHLEMD